MKLQPDLVDNLRAFDAAVLRNEAVCDHPIELATWALAVVLGLVIGAVCIWLFPL